MTRQRPDEPPKSSLALVLQRASAAVANPNLRHQVVDWALRDLRDRVQRDLVTLVELAHEAYEGDYWTMVVDEQGAEYSSADAYFERILGLGAWRTVCRYVAAGRLIATAPEETRDDVRATVAAIGISKAAIAAHAIEAAPDRLHHWLSVAQTSSVDELQKRVTEALDRKRAPVATTGAHFLRAVLRYMPDDAARAEVEDFFALGERIAQTTHPVALFLFAVRQVRKEWELVAAELSEEGPRHE